jgi:hypothetical protein
MKMKTKVVLALLTFAMIGFLAMVFIDFTHESKYKTARIIEHICSFLAVAYLFYLIRKKGGKKEAKVQKEKGKEP